MISAFDARNTTAKAKGTGGLLQVSSYITGISGGSWLVSSMLFQDLPDMYDLVLGNTNKGGNLNGWHLEKDLFLPNGVGLFDQQNGYYFGCVAVSTIFYVGYNYRPAGVFYGALQTRAELDLTHRLRIFGRAHWLITS